MVFSVQQIKYEFLAYIKGLGGRFGDWYVGVSEDPERDLFEAHRLERTSDPWIYKPALTSRASATVLRYFRENLKTDGADPADVPDRATFVFLFRKSAQTFPSLKLVPAFPDRTLPERRSEANPHLPGAAPTA